MTSSIGNQIHTKRILKDVREFYKENLREIFIVPSESNITKIFALIIGPKNTPYENGFFYFLLDFPSTYPIKPPSVKLLTTGNKTVRFNPNLYSDGKVCLSILGTWTGPAWSPVQTLFTVLLSIQSLLNEKPYHNEPGFEETNSKVWKSVANVLTNRKTDVDNYNEMITHETIRVAVIEMLNEDGTDASNMHPALKNVMISHFIANYRFYEELIKSKLHLDGKDINDPFRDRLRPKTFEYKKLLKKMEKLKETFCDSKESPIEDGVVKGFQAKPVVSYDMIAKEIIDSDYTQHDYEEEDLLGNFMDETDDGDLYNSSTDNEDNNDDK